MKPSSVFDSPLAGRWFSASASGLRDELAALQPVPSPAYVTGVCAVVVPHAGYRYSGRIASEVYARLAPTDFDRAIVIGPSHHVAMSNSVSIAQVSGYRTPLGTSPADADWIARTRGLVGVQCIPEAHSAEHSDQIQVPLIQSFLGVEMPIVCVVAGHFEPSARQSFARRLRPVLDERTLVVVSTDFTHFGPRFGYQPFVGCGQKDVAERLAQLDGAVFDAFAAWDVERFVEVLDRTGATVCGREVLALLLELAPTGALVTRTGYTTSGHVLGDWSNTVSYVGAVVQGTWDGVARSGLMEDGHGL